MRLNFLVVQWIWCFFVVVFKPFFWARCPKSYSLETVRDLVYVRLLYFGCHVYAVTTKYCHILFKVYSICFSRVERVHRNGLLKVTSRGDATSQLFFYPWVSGRIRLSLLTVALHLPFPQWLASSYVVVGSFAMLAVGYRAAHKGAGWVPTKKADKIDGRWSFFRGLLGPREIISGIAAPTISTLSLFLSSSSFPDGKSAALVRFVVGLIM